MPSSYELWLTDDTGKRITLLNTMFDGIGYFSYSRTTKGFGTCLIGIPYENYIAKVFPIFQPDWRVDIWRSPETGFPTRHEGTYLLRMPKIYTRETDNVQIIALYGRDPKDILRRRVVIQPAGYPQTYKTAPIDDMMKEIVSEHFLHGSVVDETGAQDNARALPKSEFMVQGNISAGPAFSLSFAERNVLDVLRELREASFQLHEEDPFTNARIFFDVLPFDIQGLVLYILDEAGERILDETGDPLLDEGSPDTASIQGFEFMTFPDLRGQDRTASALIFSLENNNLEGPYYTLNHMEEENSVIVKGYGRGDSRQVAIVDDTSAINASRWNRCEVFEDASNEPDQDNLDFYGYPPLFAGAAQEDLGCVFLNVPESPDSPRSLYGLDWDLGDLLPVEYASKQFNVEVEIVYVAIDESGRETITGRNNINASDQTG